MANMFVYATNYNQGMYWWNMSSMKDLTQMFYYATSFNQNISNWSIGNVVSYSNFRTGSSLTDANAPKRYFGLGWIPI
jgi:hypothetical protein